MKKIAESFVKKMKWYDVPLLKAAVFFFTLFLVVVWPGFNKLVMSIAWYWFLAVGIILLCFLKQGKCEGMCKNKAKKKKK